MHKSTLAGMVKSTLALAGLLSSATSAHAQAAIGEVTVTGIRLSLAKSVEVKRDADIISDAIVAEDIGKFPQQNMAESRRRSMS